jgi:hypothetical protein
MSWFTTDKGEQATTQSGNPPTTTGERIWVVTPNGLQPGEYNR